MIDLSSVQKIISEVAVPLSIVVYVINLWRKEKIEKALMSEHSRIYLLLINMFVLISILFTEYVLVQPPVSGERIFALNGYTIVGGALAVAAGVIVYSIVLLALWLGDKTQYYVYLDDKDGNHDGKEWLIIKTTDSKKVILSHVDIVSKQTIYRFEDLKEIQELYIWGMNRRSKKNPLSEVVVVENQVSTDA